MDVHVPYAICMELRMRGVDILTAQQDGTAETDDAALLDRSSVLRRVLFTRDDDLLREAAHRHHSEISFTGVIYAHQQRVSIGRCVADLEFIAQVTNLEGWVSRVEYLPLR